MRRLVILLGLLVFAASAVADPEFDLNEYRGKVVMLDFWASWCVPCRRSFPWMNSMHQKYADRGLVIIAVNVDRKTEEAEKFLESYPADFKITYDPDASFARVYGVESMPSTFVFGRDGQRVARHVGFKVKRQEEYEAAILSALELESTK